MTTTASQLPAALAQALEQTISHAAGLGEQDAARRLETARTAYTSSELRVLFFGEFNRGKSTLINALLGRMVLPARLIPTTGHVTSVISGEQEQVHLLRTGQPAEIHPLSAIDTVTSLRPDGTGREDIDEISVTVDHPLLNRQLVLLDTPGMNEDAVRNTRTEQAILRADMVVFVLDAQTLLGEYERTLAIDWLQKSWGKPILPVINFMSRVPAHEQDDVRRRMANWCSRHLDACFSPPWLEVDALGALKYAQGSAPAPVDDFAKLHALLFAMDTVDPGLRSRLQQQSRASALRPTLQSLQARNALAIASLQAAAEKAAAQVAVTRRTLEAKLSTLEADITLLRQVAADEARASLDTARQQLLGQFGGKSKAELDRSASRYYCEHLRRGVDAIEDNLRDSLEMVRDAGIKSIPPITLTERMSFERRIQVAQLPSKGADAGTVGKGALAGALLGTIFAPGPGTAMGAAIGGGLGAMFGGSKADPVAAYRAEASSAWGKDAEMIQRLLQEEITAANATLGAGIKRRLTKTTDKQTASAARELEQRTALEQAIGACELQIAAIRAR